MYPGCYTARSVTPRKSCARLNYTVRFQNEEENKDLDIRYRHDVDVTLVGDGDLSRQYEDLRKN